MLQNDGVSCLATSTLIKVSNKYGIQSVISVSCDVCEINGSKDNVHIFLLYNAVLLTVSLLQLLFVATVTTEDDEEAKQNVGRCSVPLMLF